MSIRILNVIFILAFYVPISAFSADPLVTRTNTNSAETVKHVINGLAEYKPVTVWQSIPKKYQNDINKYTRSFISIIEKDNYNKLMGLGKRIASALKNKRILIEKTFAKTTNDQFSMKRKHQYKIIVDILDAYVNSDLGDYDKAIKIDLGSVLATSGSTLMKTSIESDEQIIKEFNTFTNTKVELIKSENGREEIEYINSSLQKKEKLTFVKIDGHWIPESMAISWDKGIVKLKNQLSDMKEKAKAANKTIAKILPLLENFVTEIENANSEKEIIKATEFFKLAFISQVVFSDKQKTK